MLHQVESYKVFFIFLSQLIRSILSKNDSNFPEVNRYFSNNTFLVFRYRIELSRIDITLKCIK